jgi:hypothetical protein
MSAAGTVPGDPAACSGAASDSPGLPPASTGAPVVGMSIAGSGGGAASVAAAASSAGGRSGEENRDARCGSGSDSADTGITVSGSSTDAGRSGYRSPAGASLGSGSCPTGRARQRSAGEVSCAGRASSVGGSMPGSPSGFELRASGLGRLAPLSTALATVASPRSSWGRCVRPMPRAHTRPKPTAAQTQAPITAGRLDCRGGTTSSWRDGVAGRDEASGRDDTSTRGGRGSAVDSDMRRPSLISRHTMGGTEPRRRVGE